MFSFQGTWATSGSWTTSSYLFTVRKLPNFRRCQSRVGYMYLFFIISVVHVVHTERRTEQLTHTNNEQCQTYHQAPQLRWSRCDGSTGAINGHRVRLTGVVAGTTVTSTECCYTVGTGFRPTSTHYACVKATALAAGQVQNPVQAGDTDASLLSDESDGHHHI